jgi:O-antigen/teichoic acid export membrane protein
MLRRNVIANFLGSGVNAVVGLLLIPVYINYMGIEAWGLVGLYATLTAVFGLMDFGLGLTLNRGLARLTVEEGTIAEQRNLVRTLETVYWALAIAIAVLIFSLAGLIAESWLKFEHLPAATVTAVVRLMSLLAALQFPFALYQAALLGLQRQVLLNGILVAIALARGIGSVLVLALVSPAPVAYFAWQAIVTLAQTGWVSACVWRSIQGDTPPRFKRTILKAEWSFALTVSLTSILGAILTQSDKILLSGLMPLAEFGYYTLAGTLASALWFIILPLNIALYPRFAQLTAGTKTRELVSVYHRSCQVMIVALAPVSLTLILFAPTIVDIWLHGAAVPAHVSSTIRLLVVGTTLNGIASLPLSLQAAAGMPRLTMFTHLVMVPILVPLIVIMSSRFGAPGAAAVWALLNAVYVCVTIPLMHRRLLRGELMRWYVDDVLYPFVGGTMVGVTLWIVAPRLPSRAAAFSYVAFTALLIAAGVLSMAKGLRGSAVNRMRAMLG